MTLPNEKPGRRIPPKGGSGTAPPKNQRKPAKQERSVLPAVLVFDVPGHDGTAASRLKRMMKAALRGYGLRCIEIRRPTDAEMAAKPDGASFGKSG